MGFKVRGFFKKMKKSLSTGFKSIGGEEGKSAFKIARKDLVKNFATTDTKILKKLDDIPSPEVTMVKGEVNIGKSSISELEFHLESGRFRKLWDELKIDNLITKEVEKGMRKQIEGFPAKRIADLEEEVAKFKKGKMKDYDVPIDDLKKLPEANKSKLAKFYKGLGVVTATVGAGLAVGIPALAIDQMITELHKAKGCFLFSTSAGKGGRCKLQNRSCAYSDVPHNILPCGNNGMDKLKPNLNLVMRYLKQNNKNTIIRDFEDAMKLKLKDDTTIEDTFDKIRDQTITNKQIEEFIEKLGFEDAMNEFIERHEELSKISNFCGLLDDVERKEIACVACSNTAPHSSLEYVNTEDLPETERPRCEANPTLWEAFAKTAGDTVSDLADAIGLTEAWKAIGMFVGLIFGAFVLIVGIGYAVYMIRKKQGDDDEVNYSELENEDDDDEKDSGDDKKDDKKIEMSKV